MLKLTRLRGHSKEEICATRIDHSSWNGQFRCDLLCWLPLFGEGVCSTGPELSGAAAGVCDPWWPVWCEMAVLQLSFVTGADDGDGLWGRYRGGIDPKGCWRMCYR